VYRGSVLLRALLWCRLSSAGFFIVLDDYLCTPRVSFLAALCWFKSLEPPSVREISGITTMLRNCSESDPYRVRVTPGWDIVDCRPRRGRCSLYNVTALVTLRLCKHGNKYKADNRITNRPRTKDTENIGRKENLQDLFRLINTTGPFTTQTL
jgi:hypothetical protein